MSELPARLASRITVTETCWLWTGEQGGGGYGRIMHPETRKRVAAHRLVYELLVGPIPAGLHLDHLCRVHLCVNPDHLEPVTQEENTARGLGVTAMNSRKTSCPNDHPLAGDNLRVTANGSRQCRTCEQKRAREAWPDKSKGMSRVWAMVPSDLAAAAKERARVEGTTIKAIVHQALADFAEALNPSTTEGEL